MPVAKTLDEDFSRVTMAFEMLPTKAISNSTFIGANVHLRIMSPSGTLSTNNTFRTPPRGKSKTLHILYRRPRGQT